MIYAPIPTGRLCRKCGLWKNRNELCPCPKSRFGVQQLCKKCASIQRKEARHANPEPSRVAAQEWRDRHPEAYRESRKRYRQNSSPERQRAAWKRAVAKRPEHYKDLARRGTARYRKAHPEQGIVSYQRRKARKRNLPATFTKDGWGRALGYFDNRCAACLRPRGLWHTLAQDHWIPLEKGGAYVATNIVPLCNGLDGCNQTKSNRDPVEWLNDRFGKRKAKQILKRIEDYFEWAKQQED